jgi:acyl-CoA thioesterase
MEIIVEKIKVKRISRQLSPVRIMIDEKQLENVEYSKYFGSSITHYTRCTREIKFRIAREKAAFNKKQNISHQQIGLKFREEINKVLHLEHSFVWC